VRSAQWAVSVTRAIWKFKVELVIVECMHVARTSWRNSSTGRDGERHVDDTKRLPIFRENIVRYFVFSSWLTKATHFHTFSTRTTRSDEDVNNSIQCQVVDRPREIADCDTALLVCTFFVSYKNIKVKIPTLFDNSLTDKRELDSSLFRVVITFEPHHYFCVCLSRFVVSHHQRH